MAVVIINCSAAAFSRAGAGVGRSVAQALLLKVISVQSRSWSGSSTLELTHLNLFAEAAAKKHHSPHPALLLSLTSTLPVCIL